MRINLETNIANDNVQDESVLVAEGATVAQVVELATGKTDMSSVLVRVNGARVSGSTVLNDGDTLSITPSKVPGA